MLRFLPERRIGLGQDAANGTFFVHLRDAKKRNARP